MRLFSLYSMCLFFLVGGFPRVVKLANRIYSRKSVQFIKCHYNTHVLFSAWCNCSVHYSCITTWPFLFPFYGLRAVYTYVRLYDNGMAFTASVITIRQMRWTHQTFFPSAYACKYRFFLHTAGAFVHFPIVSVHKRIQEKGKKLVGSASDYIHRELSS